MDIFYLFLFTDQIMLLITGKQKLQQRPSPVKY